jgi:soluble lytic murein transglycosylase-like protein
LIAKEAQQQGLAPAIAEAVMAVESGFNPDVIGGSGEIGLMQLMPGTARMLGFAGSNAELAVPESNIHYGVTYLAQAWRLAGGDLCTAAMKYRAGHGETRFSYLSVNYCVAVRAKLAAHGFAVTGNVPVATFGAPGSFAAGGGGGASGRKCIGRTTVGRVDLAALNTKLSALVMVARGGR